MSVDPAFDETQSRYGYVGGNPLNRVDPSGLCGELPPGASGPTIPCPQPAQPDFDREWTVKRLPNKTWHDVGDAYRFKDRIYDQDPWSISFGFRQVTEVSWSQRQETWWHEGNCLFSARRTVREASHDESWLFAPESEPGRRNFIPSGGHADLIRQQGTVTVRKVYVGPGAVMVPDDFSLF